MVKRLIFLLFTGVFALYCLLSCTKKDGKETLSKFLFSQEYAAEFDYCFSDAAMTLSGNATATKNGKVRIEFLSPEALSSMTVESDEKGDAGVIIFNYYGIRSPLPDGALSKVSALLSVFSDEMPKAVLSKGAQFCDIQSENGDKNLAECLFTLDGQREVSIIFDKISGFPTKYHEKNQNFELSLTFTKIIPSDSVDKGTT